MPVTLLCMERSDNFHMSLFAGFSKLYSLEALDISKNELSQVRSLHYKFNCVHLDALQLFLPFAFGRLSHPGAIGLYAQFS